MFRSPLAAARSPLSVFRGLPDRGIYSLTAVSVPLLLSVLFAQGPLKLVRSSEKVYLKIPCIVLLKRKVPVQTRPDRVPFPPLRAPVTLFPDCLRISIVQPLRFQRPVTDVQAGRVAVACWLGVSVGLVWLVVQIPLITVGGAPPVAREAWNTHPAPVRMCP